ncbi:MAG: insulinase family protein, partial [Cupriavidus sp.]|nr:insulinase family protein [Cupriavidus sp.]
MNHCAVMTATGAPGSNAAAQTRTQRHAPHLQALSVRCARLARRAMPALLLALLPWSLHAAAQGVVAAPMPAAQT